MKAKQFQTPQPTIGPAELDFERSLLVKGNKAGILRNYNTAGSNALQTRPFELPNTVWAFSLHNNRQRNRVGSSSWEVVCYFPPMLRPFSFSMMLGFSNEFSNAVFITSTLLTVVAMWPAAKCVTLFKTIQMQLTCKRREKRGQEKLIGK